MRDSTPFGLSLRCICDSTPAGFGLGLSGSGIKQIASPLRLCREGYLFYGGYCLRGLGNGDWELRSQLSIRNYLSALLSESPLFGVGVVDYRELGEGACEVGGGDEGASGEHLLCEADGNAQSDHAVLTGVFGVEKGDCRAAPADRGGAVAACMDGDESRGRGGIGGGGLRLMRFGVEGERERRAGYFHGVDGAVEVPPLAFVAVRFGGTSGLDYYLVAPLVALARVPEQVRHISVGDELLYTVYFQGATNDGHGDLGGVVQPFGAVGHTEFSLNFFEQGQYFCDAVTGVVEVYDLLRTHRPGTLGGGLFDEKVVGGGCDRAVSEVNGLDVCEDIVAVGSTLLNGTHRLPCGLEAVEQGLNSGDGVGRTGSGEQVGDALQDSTERLRGNGVLGLQLSEVRDNLRE